LLEPRPKLKLVPKKPEEQGEPLVKESSTLEDSLANVASPINILDKMSEVEPDLTATWIKESKERQILFKVETFNTVTGGSIEAQYEVISRNVFAARLRQALEVPMPEIKLPDGSEYVHEFQEQVEVLFEYDSMLLDNVNALSLQLAEAMEEKLRSIKFDDFQKQLMSQIQQQQMQAAAMQQLQQGQNTTKQQARIVPAKAGDEEFFNRAQRRARAKIMGKKPR
jgi:hypothetical protein